MIQQISPVFHHRVSQRAPTALANLGSSILFMTARAQSVLALVRTQFDASASRRLDEDVIYYAFSSVDLEFKDIRSCKQDFIQAGGVDGQKLEQGVLNALTRIDLAFSGTQCVIYFLCELFGNGHNGLKDELILGAIDFLIQQMTEIGEITRIFHTIEVRS